MTPDMKLLTMGAVLVCLAFVAGMLMGYAMHRQISRDEILVRAAALKNQQDEIERISLGLRDGLIDAEGHRVKLIAPSALKRASTEQLEQIAKQRGLLTMQNLGERDLLIEAITQFQRRLTAEPKWKIGPGKVTPNPNDGPNEGRRYT